MYLYISMHSSNKDIFFLNYPVGSWIIYKASNNLKHKLVSYELMSANDAPERDPMDWYVNFSVHRIWHNSSMTIIFLLLKIID